jgi:hypothetical protein
VGGDSKGYADRLLHVLVKVFVLEDYLKLVLLAFVVKAFREVLRLIGKKIRLGPLRPGAILDLEVKFREELYPVGLTAV